MSTSCNEQTESALDFASFAFYEPGDSIVLFLQYGKQLVFKVLRICVGIAGNGDSFCFAGCGVNLDEMFNVLVIEIVYRG